MGNRSSAPLITVIMPTYNSAGYIYDSVKSILDQSLDDFELLILDDGSTDNTEAIVNKINDDRICYERSNENRGLITTLNSGVELAKGKYIARMDSDDVSEPLRFEKQLVCLERTKAQLCGTWVKTFGRKPNILWDYPDKYEDIKYRLLCCSSFAHPTIMAEAAIHKEYEYEADFESAEDYRLWTRLAVDGIRMTNVQEPLLKYRRHGYQESHTKAVRQRRTTEYIAELYREEILGVDGVKLNTLLHELRNNGSRRTIINVIDILSDILDCWGVSVKELDNCVRILSRSINPMGPYVYNTVKKKLSKIKRDDFNDYPLLLQSYLCLDREGIIYQKLKKLVS